MPNKYKIDMIIKNIGIQYIKSVKRIVSSLYKYEESNTINFTGSNENNIN